jgi:hypothetical protein
MHMYSSRKTRLISPGHQRIGAMMFDRQLDEAHLNKKIWCVGFGRYKRTRITSMHINHGTAASHMKTGYMAAKPIHTSIMIS